MNSKELFKKDTLSKKISSGDAVILTASELKQELLSGKEIFDSVDLITCGTCGVMSGTYAVLSVPVASQGSFIKADMVTLNGVPAIPGPCPNERLGIVDLIVYGTANRDSNYGGGHLIRDIISGNEITVNVTSCGKEFEKIITKSSIPFARLFTSRSSFKNYSGFVNLSDKPVKSIFSVTSMPENCTGLTVSGCGDINPIQNDPNLRFLKPGTPILVNGGVGFVIGQGTRSSIGNPNLSVHGEMKGMDESFCGGFKTSAGPECITSIATAIPIDAESAKFLSVTDNEITLDIVDIADRKKSSESDYSKVWSDTANVIKFASDKCLNCEVCIARVSCPVDAINSDRTINQNCFVCGTCTYVCIGNAYNGNNSFGSVNLQNKNVPIILRQSDRRRADLLCKKMRDMLFSGEVSL